MLWIYPLTAWYSFYSKIYPESGIVSLNTTLYWAWGSDIIPQGCDIIARGSDIVASVGDIVKSCLIFRFKGNHKGRRSMDLHPMPLTARMFMEGSRNQLGNKGQLFLALRWDKKIGLNLLSDPMIQRGKSAQDQAQSKQNLLCGDKRNQCSDFQHSTTLPILNDRRALCYGLLVFAFLKCEVKVAWSKLNLSFRKSSIIEVSKLLEWSPTTSDSLCWLKNKLCGGRPLKQPKVLGMCQFLGGVWELNVYVI